jgi:predicted  nucleic acid-binding Zn-ribbon protein
MRAIAESMYQLQQLVRSNEPTTPAGETQIRKLRAEIPAQVLGHFDRLMKQGRAGVALVRHGVCGECHLRVSVGTLASLIRPKDLHLCDNCGSYLLMPQDEVGPTSALLSPNLPDPPIRRKPRAAVA